MPKHEDTHAQLTFARLGVRRHGVKTALCLALEAGQGRLRMAGHMQLRSAMQVKAFDVTTLAVATGRRGGAIREMWSW
jgi:hypothetical protein